MSLLEIRGVTVRFGGNTAVNDVSVDAGAGTVTGLIGPNGAGKTTLFNAVTGLQRPSAPGAARRRGHHPALAGQARRAGASPVPFSRWSSSSRCRCGTTCGWPVDIAPAGRRQRLDLAAETDRILELTGLTDIADKDVSDIPTGRARVVEVARALMTSPRLLLLDKPASGQTRSTRRTCSRRCWQPSPPTAWRSASSSTTCRW